VHHLSLRNVVMGASTYASQRLLPRMSPGSKPMRGRLPALRCANRVWGLIERMGSLADMAAARTHPSSDHPEPGDWDEPEWEAQQDETRRRRDLLEVHALAHYVHRGHPYRLALRSPNAVRWIKPGQYVMFLRLDASDEFWRIHDELKRRYEQE